MEPFSYHYKVFDDRMVVVAGDARRILTIPPDMDGLALVELVISVTTVSSSGIVQVQLRNIDNANADMLSTRVQIDQGELNSQDATTAYAINQANAVVRNKNRIAIDIDLAGTGAKGLELVAWFSEPPIVVPPSTQPDYPDSDAQGIAFAFASDTHETPVWQRVDA